MAERDLIDWADVAAVGLCVREWMGLYEHPLAAGMADAAANPTETAAAAAALRSAYEAGLRERIDVLDCDACGERHLTERGAEMASENRELREEVARLRRELEVYGE